MKQKWLGLLIVVILMFVGTCAFAEAGNLTVQGTGVVYMNADRATITIGVREIADDVMQAQDTVNEKMASIIRALTEKGILAEDIFTSTINIYPNYDYTSSEERIVGYTVYNSVSARTDDIGNVGVYIDAAFEAGANTLDNIEFSALDTEQAADEALALAIQNAMNKAQVIADAAGMALDGIEEIREESTYDYGNAVMKYAESAMGDGTGTRVIASQLQISATVSVEFKLKQVG